MNGTFVLHVDCPVCNTFRDEKRLAAVGMSALGRYWWFKPVKWAEGFFLCRLAENYKTVLHDKEEPRVCALSCAYVLDSQQLINSNYF